MWVESGVGRARSCGQGNGLGVGLQVWGGAKGCGKGYELGWG